MHKFSIPVLVCRRSLPFHAFPPLLPLSLGHPPPSFLQLYPVSTPPSPPVSRLFISTPSYLQASPRVYIYTTSLPPFLPSPSCLFFPFPFSSLCCLSPLPYPPIFPGTFPHALCPRRISVYSLPPPSFFFPRSFILSCLFLFSSSPSPLSWFVSFPSFLHPHR